MAVRALPRRQILYGFGRLRPAIPFYLVLPTWFLVACVRFFDVLGMFLVVFAFLVLHWVVFVIACCCLLLLVVARCRFFFVVFVLCRCCLFVALLFGS